MINSVPGWLGRYQFLLPLWFSPSEANAVMQSFQHKNKERQSTRKTNTKRGHFYSDKDGDISIRA
jgi:hypothetical protein